MCVLIVSTTVILTTSHSTKNWVRYDKKIYTGVDVKFCCQILKKLEFILKIFEKNTQTSNFMKIRPLGVELFHADRRTERQTYNDEETNSRFEQFFERS